MRLRSIRATRDEQKRSLPGDDLIPSPLGSFTHAITIRGARDEVWPWLAQMGAGRAGWYSYDAVDNGRQPSADRIVGALQNVEVGTLFPTLPGAIDAFHVLMVEPERFLVLGWKPAPDAAPRVTWAFVLDEQDGGRTRLIVRARGARTYSTFGLPARLGGPLIQAVHFVMERKQLLGIASRVEAGRSGDADPLLDRVMADYDVVARHHVRVAAPADVALAAAMDIDVQRSRIIRGLFRAREAALGAPPQTATRGKGLMADMLALGWRVLAEEPGREVVVGAVTQPWLAEVVFRGLSPEAFRTFGEPDYVKIAWTLRADPVGPAAAIFRTETRVVATDAAARDKFLAYWARFSPGIVLIRHVLLRQLKMAARRRAIRQRATTLPPSPTSGSAAPGGADAADPAG